MTARADADRCPGVLRAHHAADGAVLRIRIPGGRITAEALRALGAASGRYADGEIQLTSRANLQLRGVRTNDDGSVAAGLVSALSAAGLLPHPTHERVRNIVCSPLTGLVGGLADVRPLVGLLDAALCAAPDLAVLPGPFLFALDDGRGDLDVARADLAAVALDDRHLRVWAGGRPGPVVPIAGAACTLVDLARRFLAVAAAITDRPVWHVRELPERGAELLDGAGGVAAAPVGGPVPLGVLTQDDGAVTVSALVPLGRLTAPQVSSLAAAANTGAGELIVTPWRGVLVPDLPAGSPATEELTGTGLVVDRGSPWSGLSACPGSPRCSRGAGDTDELARRVAAAPSRGRSIPVHVVACGRACGRPSGRHVLVTVDRQSVEIRCGDVVVAERLAGAADAIGRARLEAR